ncbi:hypothetical protein Pmani_008351 [Petrolisthes manimaculis]|uniref:Uncharacterized protein n=1 Tax=Petrolisthes manimaculis TaxID=1843537 RepID=A0AAE1Q8S9_9EUCA|nr:hypothetical protein Pmani_008351 [Petrolisthes manimaculis]
MDSLSLRDRGTLCSLLTHFLTPTVKTKGPPRNKISWWWNDAVNLAIREKRRLYKEHKKGGPREPYLAAKRKAKKEVYLAKKVIQDLVIDQVSDAENPNGIFNLARRIKEDGRDIVGERCVRKDDGTITYVDKEIRDAWRVHYDRLLNVEFEWDREQLSTENPVLGPPPMIATDVVSSAINKMKDGKAAGCSGIVAEMIKAAGDSRNHQYPQQHPSTEATENNLYP